MAPGLTRQIRWTPEAALPRQDAELSSDSEDEIHEALLRRRPGQAEFFQRLSTGRYLFRNKLEVELKISNRLLTVVSPGQEDLLIDDFLDFMGARIPIDEAAWPPPTATSPAGASPWPEL